MIDFSTITPQMKTACQLHFVRGVPIGDLAVTRPQRDHLQRVEYVYQAYSANPSLDVFHTLQELSAPSYDDNKYIIKLSRRLELLVFYVVSLLQPSLLPAQGIVREHHRTHAEVVRDREERRARREAAKAERERQREEEKARKKAERERKKAESARLRREAKKFFRQKRCNLEK